MEDAIANLWPNGVPKRKQPESTFWSTLRSELDAALAPCDYTTAIDCLYSNLRKLYTARLEHNKKLNNMRAVIKDASNLINLAPTEANVYLNAGHYYEEMCEAKNALMIYNRGIKAASQDDPNYILLFNVRDKMEEKLTRRVDFLNILPSDVLALVFSMLTHEQNIRCSSVSKQWRSFIHQWPGTWRNIHIRLKYRDPSTHLLMQRKLFYMSYLRSECVRHFELQGSQHEESDTMALQLLVDAHCTHLQSLELIRCFVPADLFRAIILQAGSHLTRLVLDNNSSEFLNLTFGFVLATCPRLEHLVYSLGREVDTNFEASVVIPENNVTFLSLSMDKAGGDVSSLLRTILCGLKKLKGLQTTFPHEQLRSVVACLMEEGTCPELCWLDIGSSSVITFHVSGSDSSTEYKGLRVLGVDLGSEVMPLITMHSNSLRALSCLYITNASQAWPDLRVVQLPHLSELSLIDTFALHRTHDIKAILEKCPKLSVLRLTSMAISTRGITVTMLQSLREIHFQYFSVDQGPEGLIHLLRQGTCLEYIQLSSSNDVTDDVLAVIGTMINVKRLHIGYCHKLTDDGVRCLVQGAAQLDFVSIKYCNSVSPTLLRSINRNQYRPLCKPTS